MTESSARNGDGPAGGAGGDGGDDQWIVILDRNGSKVGGAGAPAVAAPPKKWYEHLRVRVFRGVREDFFNRLACYGDDWRVGKARAAGAGATDRPGLLKLLAPATYIFLASFIPALAFGQQLSDKTSGKLGVVQVLASTCIAGVIQSVAGGQPLMIVGVAEPIVLIYGCARIVPPRAHPRTARGDARVPPRAG